MRWHLKIIIELRTHPGERSAKQQTACASSCLECGGCGLQGEAGAINAPEGAIRGGRWVLRLQFPAVAIIVTRSSLGVTANKQRQPPTDETRLQ